MIQTVKARAALCSQIDNWKAAGYRVGYVPTMGALHDGHMSLVKLALAHADRVVVSIFVNPTQFAPGEDFESYPRDEAADTSKLEAAGAHLVYLPSRAEIYPDGEESAIKAGQAAQGLETDFRPSFFNGVVNVVSRLFDHVRPDVAIFGKKDFQQLQVIKEMVEMRDMGIEIIGAEIVRDDRGLALSSRNAYLNDDELQIARKLNTILRETAAELSSRAQPKDFEFGNKNKVLPYASHGRHDIGENDKLVLRQAEQKIIDVGFDHVDYVSARWGRILAAAWLGKARLIDNVGV